jgi:hypothetical protein
MMIRSSQGDVLVQLDGHVMGPWPVSRLTELKGFNGKTFISFPGSEKWAPAFRVLKGFSFDAPLTMGSDNDSSIGHGMLPTLGIQSIMNEPTPSRVMDFVAAPLSSWVDRWFRRLALFNLLLAVAGYVVWSNPILRMRLERELPAELQPARLEFLLRQDLKRWTPVHPMAPRQFPQKVSKLLADLIPQSCTNDVIAILQKRLHQPLPPQN